MTYKEITRNGVESAEPLEFPTKRLSITTVVQYRGRTFTVSAEGYTMDKLCDMLDEKFGAAGVREEHTAPAQAPDSPPVCPVHKRPMKAMKFASKRGELWMCTFRFEDGSYCDERA